MTKNSKPKSTLKKIFIFIGFSTLTLFLVILIFAGVLIYQHNNHNPYQQLDDGIYYIQYPPHERPRPLEGVDRATFAYLKCHYAKDKNQVYYAGKIIQGADSESFEVIECDLAKDKNQVYKQSDVIQEADPKTFELLNDYYGKDNKNIYADTQILKEADLKTFEVIEGRYGKDAEHVYYEGKSLPEAQPETFELIGSGYSKDGNKLYYKGEYLEGRDASTFKRLKFEDHYAPREFTKDSTGLYLNNQKLKGANPEIFQLMEQPDFGKDDRHLFYKHYQVEGVDVESLEMIRGTYPQDKTDYFKDKNGAYFVYEELASGSTIIPQKLEDADLETLEVNVGHFSRNYLAKTKDFVYFRGKKIEGIEPKGFWIFHPHYAEDKEAVYGVFQEIGVDKVFVPLEGSEHWNFEVLSEKDDEISFAKDGKQVYSNGRIIPIEGVDVASVELLPYGFFKDRSRIYCQPTGSEEWKVLEGADSQSFEFVYNGAEYSRDKDSFYNYCQPIESFPPEVATFVDNAENSSQIACNHHGGTWQLFTDRCANICDERERLHFECGDVEIYSCACSGQYECWNGSSCEEHIPPSMGI